MKKTLSLLFALSGIVTARAATMDEQAGMTQIDASNWSLKVNDINDIIIIGDDSRRDIDSGVTAIYELARSQEWDNSENQLWGNTDYLIGTNGLVTITAADEVTADLKVSGADRFLINKEGAITQITGLRDVHFINMGLNEVNPSSSPNLHVEHAAIEIATASSLSISDNNGKVSFTDYDITPATAGLSVNGGVFWLGSNTATLEISRNAGGVFFQNLAITREKGTGAIYGGVIHDASNSTTPSPANNDIWINYNGSNKDGESVVFDKISISSTGNIYGGVAYMAKGHLQISNNQGDVIFSSNSISTAGSKTSHGAVIYLGTGATALMDNNKGDVIFSSNTEISETGISHGAVVYGSGSTTTAFSASGNSGQVAFTNNAASGKRANGAAIYMDTGSITLNDNGSVLISDNHADNTTTSSSKMQGGAIYSTGLLSISGNIGNVTIQNNYLSSLATATTSANSVMGGAIYSTAKAMAISNNAGGVSITGNHVDATGVAASANVGGGAIYSTNAPLIMEGNGDVEFSGNYVRLQNSLSFNAVTMKPTKASTDTAPILKLAAGEGKSIIFRDSVNINASKSQIVSLNADYTNAGGETCQATGNIVFTGNDAAGNGTAQRIVNLKTSLGLADTTASEAEVSASQTSKLNAAVKLHNGTLRVEDGAHLQSTSLTVAANALVKLTNGAITMGESVTIQAKTATGEISNVLIESGRIAGGASRAAMSDVFIRAINETFSISDVNMENVRFESTFTALELTNVSFDDGSSFSVGDAGIIYLNNAVVNISLDDIPGNGGIFTADLSDLFHCSTEGQLELNIDTEVLAQYGYTGLAVQFGEDVNADALTIKLDGVTYSYAGDVNPDGSPSFSINIVPEPSTASLSLLALAGLAARRRRK